MIGKQLSLFSEEDKSPSSVVAALDELSTTVAKVRRKKRLPSLAQIQCRQIFGDGPRWPSGNYRANCGCLMQVEGKNVYSTPCENHESIGEAVFEKPREMVEKEDLAANLRRRFFQLPWAKMPAEYDQLLGKHFVHWNKKTMGDPTEWKDKTFTLDAPYNCGCVFVHKSLHVKGTWMITRSWTKHVAMRVYSCNKPPDQCCCRQYPIFPSTTKIGLILRTAVRGKSF